MSEPKRPLFSIIIPCYNDGRYAEGNYLDRLLDSIVVPKTIGVEVIVVDDCSPVPFDDIIEKHSSRLNIKKVKTDYNCCPGNTRQKGVDVATGEWLCFADHDDMFYPGALRRVSNSIKAHNEKNLVVSAFDRMSLEGEVLHTYECAMNWCHGKFYNLDNFWNRFKIRFVRDLKSHEDTAICSQVACALSRLGDVRLSYVSKPVYAWTDNPESLSHSLYTLDVDGVERSFLEVNFEDYLTATGYIYLVKFMDGMISEPYAYRRFLSTLYFGYFYTQGFQFAHPDNVLYRNFKLCGEYLHAGMNLFDKPVNVIYKDMMANHAELYFEIRELAEMGSGPYIPFQSLYQWLDLVFRAGVSFEVTDRGGVQVESESSTVEKSRIQSESDGSGASIENLEGVSDPQEQIRSR